VNQVLPWSSLREEAVKSANVVLRALFILAVCPLGHLPARYFLEVNDGEMDDIETDVRYAK